jgi:splicing factor 3B subunit 3
LHVGDIPQDRQRSKFLAVGFADSTVKIFSLDLDSCLMRLSSQALPNTPKSVCLIEYSDPNHNYMTDEVKKANNLFLHIGLSNGGLFRTSIDEVTGSLTETRTRFLGNKPVKLFKINVAGRPCLIALSSRSWIGYLDRNNYMLSPILNENLDFLSGFHSEKICKDGMVGIVKQTLKIFRVENLGELFSQTVVPLKNLPRKIEYSPSIPQVLFIMSSAHRRYPEQKNKELLAQLKE